jgi:hypothetical protein
MYLINLFNNLIFTIFNFIFKTFKIQSIEDKFHNKNKNNNYMNQVKAEFKNKDEYDFIKNKVLNIIEDTEFLKKFNITSESILNNTNNKIHVSFKDNCMYMFFNHYYISGSNIFVLLSKTFNNGTLPIFLKSNPFLGIINLPFYLYYISTLKRNYYPIINNKKIEHFVVEKNIITHNKKGYLCLSILKQVYTSLQMNRPMIAAITLGFEDLPYINNNVGLIIIEYEITDTIETLNQKMIKASYQAYCSNFIINCPLPNFGNYELRDYVDCIISSMYIKTDVDFKIAWNCAKPTIEQMYVGSISILRSDKTMDLNMNFNTCSANYNNPNIYNFFE